MRRVRRMPPRDRVRQVCRPSGVIDSYNNLAYTSQDIGMDSVAETILNNLHVIGSLSANDKLNTNSEAFDIYTPTITRGLYRTYYRESRRQNVERIRMTVRSAISLAASTLDDANALCGTNSTDVFASRPRILDTTVLYHVQIMNALMRCAHGLHNLHKTYSEDPAFISQIQFIVDEIHVFHRVAHPRSQRLWERCGIEERGACGGLAGEVAAAIHPQPLGSCASSSHSTPLSFSSSPPSLPPPMPPLPSASSSPVIPLSMCATPPQTTTLLLPVDGCDAAEGM